MTPTEITLIAPGSAALPPNSSTSIEIYLYDLWRTLRKRVDTRLYGCREVLSGGPHHQRRTVLEKAVGRRYVPAVLEDLRVSSGASAQVVQVDNRPAHVQPVRLQMPSCGLVLGLHSLTFLQPQRIGRAAAASALGSVDRIVVNSSYLHTALHDSFSRVSADCRVIYPGIDCDLFHPCVSRQERLTRSELRRRLGVRQEIAVLFVGRVIERKGVAIAIEALRALRRQFGVQAVLWVAGPGPHQGSRYARVLRRLAKGVPVRLLGMVKRSQLPDLYRASDLFVCPSQQPEALGLVNLEAQACGLPVVASNDWGIRESVGDGRSGTLVSSYKSPVAFARALSQLARDQDMRRTYGTAGALWMRERWSWERSAEEYMRMYSRIR